MSPEMKLIFVFAFLMIIIVGELIYLLRNKMKFCKGKATVGFIVRKHLYSSSLMNETDEEDNVC